MSWFSYSPFKKWGQIFDWFDLIFSFAVLVGPAPVLSAGFSIIPDPQHFVKQKVAQSFDLRHPEICALCTTGPCQVYKVTKYYASICAVLLLQSGYVFAIMYT
jgi:hypothetical protein